MTKSIVAPSAWHPSRLGWGLTCLFFCGVLVFGYFTLSVPETYFAAITVLALSIWGFELLPEAPVAVVLPALYVLFGVAPAKQVFGPWSSTVGWVMVGGLLLGSMMGRTGLARRIALWATNVMGGSFIRVLWGILLGGMILAPFVPSAMGKAAIVSVICIGICDALGIAKGTKESSAVILTGFIAVAAPKMAYITGGGDILLSMTQVSTAMQIPPYTWMGYFIHNFVPAMLYSVVSLVTLIAVLRPKLAGDIKSVVAEQYASLGPMKRDEYKVAATLALLLLLMLTDSVHKIDIGWLMLVIPFIAFLPGYNVMTKEAFDKLPFPAVFFVVGCMSIGAAASGCGIDKTMSAAVLPLLRGSELYSVFMSFAAGVGINFLLTPLAAVSTFTVPLVEIAKQLNIDPLLMVYAFNYGLEQYIFPYEFAVLLFFASFGYTKLSHIIMVFGARMIVSALLLAFVFYPFWKYVM